jgi:hypothetical protein
MNFENETGSGPVIETPSGPATAVVAKMEGTMNCADRVKATLNRANIDSPKWLSARSSPINCMVFGSCREVL